MQIYFGRISENSSNKNQLTKGFYDAKRGTSYFAELNDIDDFSQEPVYVYMISSNNIELWKASHWGPKGNRLHFEKTNVDLDGLNRAWFPALKFFYLDQELVVFTTRRPNRKAFFKIQFSSDLTEKALLDTQTYSNLENYRYIETTDHPETRESKNVILYRDSSGIKCIQPQFSDKELFGKFRDNSVNIGKGRYNKDGILNKVINSFAHNKIWQPNELTLMNFYDAFLCDYNPEVEDVLNIRADENIYKISMGTGEIDDDTFNQLIEDNLVIVHGNTPAKGRSSETQGAVFTDNMVIGDYFYLCRSNQSCTLVGKITSETEPCHISEYGDNGWLQRRFQIVKEAVTDEKYTGENKWWSPKNRSTCAVIPKNEYKLASTLLFAPHFSLTIQELNENAKPKQQNPENNPVNSANTILFGPPGTGKTYSTIDRALALLGEDTNGSRENRKTVFTEYQKKGRIFFCSFHQNFSYEDFIEGIKPMEPDEYDEFLKYEIKDGLFMRACVEATYSYLLGRNKSDTGAIQHFLDFNALFDQLFDEVSDAGAMQLTIKSEGVVSVTTTTKGNFAIRHEGKETPYSVSRDRLSILYEEFPNLSEVTNISNAFRGAIGGCNATAYWSVLNKLQELGKEKNKSKGKIEETLDPNIGYEEKKSIVKKYWTLRDTSLAGKQALEPYVFIIDEINRGNVSQIFGELITLIEDDKRIGKEEALYLDLPYSKHPFGVPPNLHIIGTMNTADRSVEALDTALRRRFSFVPMMPDVRHLKVTKDEINLPAILTTLNKRLRVLKDNDHTIGHAWFWNIEDLAGLKQVFANKVLPLLQEYFYNDYEKLGLLLGDAFFEKQEQVSSNIFANFSGGNGLAGQYEQSWQYELKAVSALKAVDFKTLEQ